MNTLTVKIFIYVILICSITGCKSVKNNSGLKKFSTILSQSDRIVVRFGENNSAHSRPLIRIINRPSVINELNELLQQSEEGSNCNFIDGTMTFFSGLTKKGFLEFSVNPNCPAFYLHDSDKVIQYKMSVFCGMFLESVRQGEKL